MRQSPLPEGLGRYDSFKKTVFVLISDIFKAMFIRIKTIPSCKKEELIKKGENSFEIRVKEDPVMGRATDKVIELVAQYFDIDKGLIRIKKGAKERSKILELPDSCITKSNQG